MFSQPYSTQAAALPQPRWGRGLLYALGVHLALVWLFYWPQTSLPPVLMPPPAIMLSWAGQIEAPSQPKPLPLGVQQQADSSAARPAQQQREPEMPELARAEAAKIVVAERSKNAHKQQRKAPPKPPTPMENEQDVTHSAAASTAAPKAQNLAQRVAAPLNSDSSAQAQAKLSWESQVKGMLNRVKRYPADAKRRQRSGAPVVSFVVDAQGRVADVVLKTPSATASLDREALAVILRAQPLPSPPAEMLRQGKIAVTMAVDFNLALL
ncbi:MULTISPECIES: energy transducer TonB family protein [Serratia]|uniref:energy transducer TonB family protein n=1 Tax=Serratia TaxID=613 RepID=UPI00093BF2ED|nr:MULTISPECIES: energy transducer TonB [Serratia]MBE0149876.1 energy transducer TonB [Serratia fonticola]OKP26020.1 energy transducer TonB [Serratia fonticola]